MNIPTELWHLILQTHDLDTYTHTLIVNKLFHKIIKKILNDIPDKIEIKFIKVNYRLFCLNNDNKNHICNPINNKNNKEKWFQNNLIAKSTLCDICTKEESCTISKFDLLFSRKIVRLFSKGKSHKFPLPRKYNFKNKNVIIIKFKYLNTPEIAKLILCYE